jgi:outer membrane protein
MKKQLTIFGVVAASLSLANPVRAADGDAPTFKHWFVRAGPAEVIYDEGAKIRLGGQTVPGASVTAKNNFTGEIEAGYYFNPNVSVSLTVGAPPTATLVGTGPLAGVKLGKITYGPAVAAIQYHVTDFGPRFIPYIGAGVNYTIVLSEKDGAVQNLRVKSPVGVTFQAGAESMINDRFGLFIDAKKIVLDTTARGNVGGVPADAKIKINPLIVTGGISFHF